MGAADERERRMNDFLYLIPVALGMGAIGLGVFLWSLRSGQYEDLDGAAERILFDDEAMPPSRKAELPPMKARDPR
jgi:cbb3-type cytochrome oxidase maturation protein